ncbi:hypothetical protein GCM10010495_64150 [Kitasatospora herbaricolor]|nr:hypothetical protein GCM10010495_64150 [Kitasatospora herbaricolor]
MIRVLVLAAGVQMERYHWAGDIIERAKQFKIHEVLQKSGAVATVIMTEDSSPRLLVCCVTFACRLTAAPNDQYQDHQVTARRPIALFEH